MSQYINIFSTYEQSEVFSASAILKKHSIQNVIEELNSVTQAYVPALVTYHLKVHSSNATIALQHLREMNL